MTRTSPMAAAGGILIGSAMFLLGLGVGERRHDCLADPQVNALYDKQAAQIEALRQEIAERMVREFAARPACWDEGRGEWRRVMCDEPLDPGRLCPVDRCAASHCASLVRPGVVDAAGDWQALAGPGSTEAGQ